MRSYAYPTSFLTPVLWDNLSIIYDPTHHRLRCQGHILNLSSDGFLYKVDKEALEQENQLYSYLIPSEAELQK